MKSTFLRFFSLWLLVHLPLVAEETQGLDLTLISETKSISQGKPFTLGLHIKHHKGYHTYWKNPGIVGVPTELKWNLPVGFTASDIQFPHPELSSMADYPCHGYERDVTLLVTITPPAKFTEKQFSISADASWMCCYKNCYPGFKTLSITLPTGVNQVIDPAHRAEFSTARKEIPKVSSLITSSLLSSTTQDYVALSLKLPAKQKPLYLFSSDEQLSSDQKQSFSLQKDGSYLLKINRSKPPESGVNSLPAVIQTNLGYFTIDPQYK